MASSATNIKTIPEWDALKEDITFLNDPQNTNEFSTKLIKLLQNSSFESKSKQQSIVAKYLWPNLINTYINEIK